MAGAEEYDVNLLCFEGGSLSSERKYETQRNILYDFVCKKNIDGLIILSVSIGHFIGNDEISKFCINYHPIPVVSISLELAQIPSILIDRAIPCPEKSAVTICYLLSLYTRSDLLPSF